MMGILYRVTIKSHHSGDAQRVRGAGMLEEDRGGGYTPVLKVIVHMEPSAKESSNN